MEHNKKNNEDRLSYRRMTPLTSLIHCKNFYSLELDMTLQCHSYGFTFANVDS